MVLTASAAVLLVPAGAALLRIRPGRRAHVAAAGDSTRVVHLLTAVTAVAVGGLGVAALLGQGPFGALTTALVLGVSVLAWARATPSWGVRGVVVWALQLTAAVGLLGMLVYRMAVSDLSTPRLVVGALAWLVVLVALAPVQRHLRHRIELRAGRGNFDESVPASVAAVGSRRQGAVSLATLVVAGGVAAASIGSAPPQDPTQAGRSDSPGGDGGTSTNVPSDSGDGSTSNGMDQPGGSSATGPDRTSEDDGSSAGSTHAPTETAAPSGSTSSQESGRAPATTAGSAPTKTPGYEKEKPNRPPGRPSSPGGPKDP
ncbi:MAG TPA: hypothetical protein VLB29_10145 [Nocardioidaceae bacterium]|nr:hypothetical protein [Nocardioidaceae bacterium]